MRTSRWIKLKFMLFTLLMGLVFIGALIAVHGYVVAGLVAVGVIATEVILFTTARIWQVKGTYLVDIERLNRPKSSWR